jgi:hypothetical protein
VIRAAFLMEHTGQQLSCMLNPTELVFRRTAGLAARPSLSGPFTGGTGNDEPLLFTGGGRTELDLDLVFDTSIPGSSIRTDDVRELTRPLWQLAENSQVQDGLATPPLVRFVWGKAWNFPGVVAAVAERFDAFEATGVPQRSWLRIKLLRVADRGLADVPPISPDDLAQQALAPPEESPTAPVPGDYPLPSDEPAGADEGDAPFQRADLVAYRQTGDPGSWRPIALASGILDVLRIPVSTVLRAASDTNHGREA